MTTLKVHRTSKMESKWDCVRVSVFLEKVTVLLINHLSANKRQTWCETGRKWDRDKDNRMPFWASVSSYSEVEAIIILAVSSSYCLIYAFFYLWYTHVALISVISFGLSFQLLSAFTFAAALSTLSMVPTYHTSRKHNIKRKVIYMECEFSHHTRSDHAW